MSDAERIAIAARRWNTLRREALALRAKRNQHLCAHESQHWPVSLDDGSRAPCWKHTELWHRTDSGLAPIEDWCDSCRARQAVQEDIRALNRRRGAALRELQRLCSLVEPAS